MPFDFDAGSRTNAAVFQQKIAQQGRIMPQVLERFETHFLQRVFAEFMGIARSQPLNSRDRAIDHALQLVAQFGSSIFPQTALRLLLRKPCGVAIRFLWRFEMGHFAQMSSNGGPSRGTGRRIFVRSAGKFIEVVAGERHFLDPPMNPGFFKGLKRRRLSLRQARLNATFGEDPAPAARLNQKEFHALAADAVANGRHLLASTDLPKARRGSALGQPPR